MSVQAMTAVSDHSKATLGTRLVLLSLANYYGDHGAWPSVDSISRDCLLSARQVQRCIRKAEELGELEVDPQAGPHGTNVYTLLLLEGTSIRRPDNPGPDMSPEPKELPTRGLEVVTTASRESSPQEPPDGVPNGSRPLYLPDRAPHLLDRLRAVDEAWEKVTPGAIVRIAKETSMDSAMTALSFAAVNAPVLDGSAYGWLRATARGLEEAKQS